MGDQDLEMRFGISPEEGIAGIDAVEKKAEEAQNVVKSLGDEGQRAGQKIADGAKPAAVALTDVEAAEKKLEEALKRLENAQGPRALAKGSKEAQYALMEYKATAEAAGVSTGRITDTSNRAGAALTAAAGKTSVFNEQMGALRTQGALAAQGMESLGARMGSLEGALALAKETGGETARTMAEMGLAAVAVAAGLQLAQKGAEGIKTAAKEAGDAFVAWVTKTKEAELNSVLMGQALEAVKKGLISAGPTITATVENWKSYVTETNHAKQITDEWVKTIDGVKIPKTFSEVAAEASKMEAKLGDAFTRSTGDLIAFATANKAKLDEITERYRMQGESVPQNIAKSLKALEEWTKAEARRVQSIEAGKKAGESALELETRKWEIQQKAIEQTKQFIAAAQSQKLSEDQIAAGLSKIAAAAGVTVDGLMTLVRSNTASREAIDATREKVTGATLALRDFSEALKTSTERTTAAFAELERGNKAYEEFAATVNRARQAAENFPGQKLQEQQKALADGQAEVNDAFGQGIGFLGQSQVLMLQVAQASDEATKAFYAQLEAMNALNEGQKKALDVATGWRDYLITLKDNYDSGTSSLIVYIQRLGEFKMQLLTLFASAKGEARDALQSIIDMIQQMVATAGATPQAADTSYTGQLERLLNNPGGAHP